MALVQHKEPVDSINLHGLGQLAYETHDHEDITTEANRLPKGFPTYLDSPLAWNGFTMDRHPRALYTLTQADCQELDQALSAFKSG
jgi:hypothetical protein